MTGPVQLFAPLAPPEAVRMPPASDPPVPPSGEPPLQATPDTIQAASAVAMATGRNSLRMHATIGFVVPGCQSVGPRNNVVIPPHSNLRRSDCSDGQNE